MKVTSKQLAAMQDKVAGAAQKPAVGSSAPQTTEDKRKPGKSGLSPVNTQKRQHVLEDIAKVLRLCSWIKELEIDEQAGTLTGWSVNRKIEFTLTIS